MRSVSTSSYIRPLTITIALFSLSFFFFLFSYPSTLSHGQPTLDPRRGALPLAPGHIALSLRVLGSRSPKVGAENSLQMKTWPMPFDENWDKNSTDEGVCSYYLGMNVEQGDDILQLHQQKQGTQKLTMPRLAPTV
ncbi:hypothetical protein F5Y15DRAFT_151292 [Xylariaceae sp. FL0016]|nr:hypothetical protein F5Y15DRAFT_151292 [Xylariaceae sp. FL0016]